MTSVPMPIDVAAMPAQMRGVSMAAAGAAGMPAELTDMQQLPAGFREFLLANLQALQGRVPSGEPGQQLPLQIDESASPEVLEAYLKAAGVEALPPDGKVLPPGMVLSKVLGDGQSIEGEMPDGEAVDGESAPTVHALLAWLSANAEDGEEADMQRHALAQWLRGGSGEGDGTAPALSRLMASQLQSGQGQSTTDAMADTVRPAEVSAAAAGSRSETSAAARPPVTLNVDVPMARPGWDQAVGGRVLWMLNNDTQSAQIKLNPPHLGPLDVRVSIEGDKANVTFTAQHAPVREALDAAIPRLREMLAENGLSLGDVNVSQHGPGGSGHGAQARGEGRGGIGEDGTADADDGQAVATSVVGEGLIDYYA